MAEGEPCTTTELVRWSIEMRGWPYGDAVAVVAAAAPAAAAEEEEDSSRPRTAFKVSAMPGTVTVLPWNWRVEGPTSVKRSGITLTSSGPRLAPAPPA